MSNLSELIGALTATGKAAKNVGDIFEGGRTVRETIARGSFLRRQGAEGGELRRSRQELEASLKPMEKMNDYQTSAFAIEQRRERVLANMLRMQKAYEASARSASDKATAAAFKDKARAIDELRNQYEHLEKQERRYMDLARRVNDLKRKGGLSAGEAEELRQANAEMNDLAPQFDEISTQIQDINAGAEELGKNMGGDVADGTEKSAKHMRDLGDNTDEAVKKTGKLSELYQGIKQNLDKITIGYLLGSAFTEFNEMTNKVIESYYSYGQSMNRVDHGILRLSKDTWNYARMQMRLQYAAIEANMPMEAAVEIYSQLSQKVRNLYRPDGRIRFNLATEAAENILAFSRITGASIDASTELYARFINHFGKTHKQAIDGMNAIAKSGQLVNETLHDMGVNGDIFINDLTGIINDAAQAFDGFTLNVEHLSSRVAFAVKTGRELGMTYDQAMDSAKQMAGIFSKPGGFLGFQAGEQLRQQIESVTAGITDAEERAQVLSDKYKISLSTGRSLDVASKDVNAQMQVMEILKGTDAGMEKQFELMKGVADNNAQSLEVFKQFVGGENLNPEQAGDLLQVLRRGGSFTDFKSHVDRTKKDAKIDEVIKNSVLGPKMIKDWILAMSPVTKTILAQAMITWKIAKQGATVAATIAKWGFIAAAIVALPKMLRLAGAWAMDRFGDKIIWLKTMGTRIGKFFMHTFEKAPAYFSGGVQVMKRMWNYVRTGSLFDKIGVFLKVAKNYLAEIPRGLHNLWALFRTGAAKATVTVVKGGRAAAGLASRAYGRLSRGFRDVGGDSSLLDRVGGGTSGALGEITDFIGDTATSFGGFGEGADKNSPDVKAYRDAKARSLRYKRQLLREEKQWAKQGASKWGIRLRKAKRFAGRFGHTTEPVAGPLGKSAFYGGTAGKVLAGTALLASVGGAMGMFDAAASENLDAPDDEKKTAGYRKYGDKIKAKQKEVDESSEALELARDTNDTALIAALEAENAAKRAEKEALEMQAKKLNEAEERYERKRKMIETLQDHVKRLKKMGRDKEADALEKRIDALKRDAGKDKGELAAHGVSAMSENAKYQVFNDTISKISMIASGIFEIPNMFKLVVPMISKVASIGTRFAKWIFPSLGKVIDFMSNTKSKVIGPVMSLFKGVGFFEFIEKIVKGLQKLSKFLGGLFGIFDGISVGMQTEGSLGRKVFAGVAAGATSMGVRIGSDLAGGALESTGVGAVGGAAVQIAGNAAAPWLAGKAGQGGATLYDKLFSTDAQIPTVLPTAPVQTSTSSNAGAINAEFGNVGPGGAVTLTIKNGRQFVQQANTRNAQYNTGFAGI